MWVIWHGAFYIKGHKHFFIFRHFMQFAKRLIQRIVKSNPSILIYTQLKLYHVNVDYKYKELCNLIKRQCVQSMQSTMLFTPITKCKNNAICWHVPKVVLNSRNLTVLFQTHCGSVPNSLTGMYHVCDITIQQRDAGNIDSIDYKWAMAKLLQLRQRRWTWDEECMGGIFWSATLPLIVCCTDLWRSPRSTHWTASWSVNRPRLLYCYSKCTATQQVGGAFC